MYKYKVCVSGRIGNGTGRDGTHRSDRIVISCNVTSRNVTQCCITSCHVTKCVVTVKVKVKVKVKAKVNGKR